MAVVALAFIAILSAACSDSPRHVPTAPTVSTAVTPAPLAAPPFPALSRPARVYVMTIESAVAIYNGGALKARYVLYDDGTFTLQYASARFGIFEYPGTYVEANGKVIFPLRESNAEPWATAIITEQTLVVSYSLMAQQADFEDGVFVRVRD
jgi:hypothetical protein